MTTNPKKRKMENRRTLIEGGDYVTSPNYPQGRGFVSGVNNGIISVTFNTATKCEFMQIPYNFAVKCGFNVVEKWYDRIKDLCLDPIKYPPKEKKDK